MQQQTDYSLNKADIVRNGRTLLSQVSLRLAAGDCMLLRGGNGTGKSSLLRYIAGLVLPQDPSHTLGCIGHTLALKDSMTVLENLEFYASGHTDSLQKALPMFGCKRFALRKIQACSAGQKQRTALTRLLLEDCDLWLLDEPTTALDKQGVEAFTNVVETLRKTGTTFVIASHTEDLSFVDMQTMYLDDYRATV